MAVKLTKTKINFPILFTISIIPDLDFLFLNFIRHRGPTHSLFFSIVFCLPFILFYKKKSIPYFIALLSHSLIGDIYGWSGIQLFWPLTTDWIYISNVSNYSSALFELILFIIITIIMIFNKDLKKILFSKTQRVYWLIPLGAVLGPLLINTSNYYIYFPTLLVGPSIFYILIFSQAIIGFKNSKKSN